MFQEECQDLLLKSFHDLKEQLALIKCKSSALKTLEQEYPHVRRGSDLPPDI